MTLRATNHRPPLRFVPFSLPIWGRIWRDYWYLTAICAGTLLAFHWLVVTFLPLYDMRYRITYVQRLPKIVRGMIGEDLLQIVTHTSITAFAYLHPVSLAILVAFAVMVATWMLVGQIDRGTIELFLGTPLSRRKLLSTTVLAGLLGGALLIAAMLLGTQIGLARTKLPDPVYMDRIFLVAVNLYALYVLILGLAVFFSAITSIRGIAVGWTMGICVGAYLLHFLSDWSVDVKKIAFLGPLHYFRPIMIASGKFDPTHDIFILLGASVVFFILAAIAFSRRDIAVV